jgi:hypothetical protein
LIYNILTSFAIGAYAIWEQDLDLSDLANDIKTRKSIPQLFKQTKKYDLFTKKLFLKWFVVALLHGIFIFSIPVLAYGFGTLDKNAKVSVCFD